MLQLEVSTDWLKSYILHNTEEEILDFIKREPMVAFVLLNAPRLLEATFPGATLSLEIQHDPEVKAWTEYLVIWVDSKLDSKEAVKRLRQIGKEWRAIAFPLRDKVILSLG